MKRGVSRRSIKPKRDGASWLAIRSMRRSSSKSPIRPPTFVSVSLRKYSRMISAELPERLRYFMMADTTSHSQGYDDAED